MRAVKRLAFTTKKQQPLKIYLLNDIHFRAGVDGNPSAPGAISDAGGDDKRYYYASPNNIRDFVAKANAERPDLILLCGDVCDYPSDFPLFSDVWSGLDPDIQQFITLGNHDFDDKTYAQIVSLLGYDSAPDIAGSKFNRYIALSDDVCVIVLDSTYNSAGNHGNHYDYVRIHPDALAWFSSVLGTVTQRQIFVATHVGPHLKNINYFDPVQAAEIQTILDASLSSNPQRNITWLFGHKHVLDVTQYTNMGASIGYLMPALILFEPGRFTELTVGRTGYSLSKRSLSY